MHEKRIIRNTSLLLVSHLIGRLIAFVLVVFLPRYLSNGFDDLGKIMFALWLTNLLSSISELGLHTPVIREISSDRSKSSMILTNALLVKVFLSLITFSIMIGISMLYHGEVRWLIIVIGGSEIINALAQLFRCIFRSFERMEFEAIGVILERIVASTLGFYLVYLGYGVIAFSWAVLLASIINAVFTISLVLARFGSIRPQLVSKQICKDLIIDALPYALSNVLYMAYFRIDGVMLKNLAGQHGDLAMGWYSTGYSFVNALTIIPGAIMGSVFPPMSKIYFETKNIDSIYTKSLKLMTVISFPMAICISLLSFDIAKVLFSHSTEQDQKAIGDVIKILVWSGALLFFNTLIATVFRAVDRRKIFVVLTAISLLVNVITNAFLIPEYAHIGTSISMVVSEFFFSVAGFYYIWSRISKPQEFTFVLKTVLISLILTSILVGWKRLPWAYQHVNLFAIIALCMLLYAGALFLLFSGNLYKTRLIGKGRVDDKPVSHISSFQDASRSDRF